MASTGVSSRTSTGKQPLILKNVFSQFYEDLKPYILSDVKEVDKSRGKAHGLIQGHVQAFQGTTTTQTTQRSGSYGTVIDLRWNGKKCVGKKLHAEFFAPDSDPNGMKSMLQNFYKEIKILSGLNHDNIVKFFGLYHKSSGAHSLPVLVMEKMEFSLTQCIKSRKQDCVSKSNVILCDVAKGLLYLHEGGKDSPLAHRDLTSNNILLSSNFRAKIADFGSARMLDIPSSAKLTLCPGTPDFMPPEALEDPPRYTVKVDVFSFGCVVIHLETGQWPTPAGSTRDGHLISEFERRKKWIAMMGDSHSLLPIVTQCLENDTKKRPSSYDLLTFLKQTRTSSSSTCSKEDDSQIIFGHQVAAKNNSSAGEGNTAKSIGIPQDDTNDWVIVKPTETEAIRKEGTDKVSWRNRIVVIPLFMLLTGVGCILAGVLIHMNMKEQEMTEPSPDLLPKQNASQVVFNSWITLNQSNLLLSHDNQTLPVIVTLSNFTERKKDKEHWFSGPFFAFTGGYKLCLSVYVDGISSGENTHVSILLHLMKGPYDDDLQQSGHWPLRGTFTIELLNQLNDDNHYTRNVTFNSTTPERYTKRVLDSDKPSVGWREVHFIPQNAIFHDNNSYLMNNNLYFRIYYVPVKFEESYSFHVKGRVLSSLFSAGVGLLLVVILKYLESCNAAKRTFAFVMFSFPILVGIGVMRNCLGGLLWGTLTLLTAFGCVVVSGWIKKNDRLQMVVFVFGFPLGNVIASIIILDILHMPWDIIVWWLL